MPKSSIKESELENLKSFLNPYLMW